MANIERIISPDLLISDLKTNNNLLTLNTMNSICITNIDIFLDDALKALLIPENIRAGVTILGITGTNEGSSISANFTVTYTPSSNQISWTTVENATYNVYYQRATTNTFPNGAGTTVSSDISATYMTVTPPSSTTASYYYWYGASYTVDGVESDVVWDAVNYKYVAQSTTTTYYTQKIYNYSDRSITVTYGGSSATIAAGGNKSISMASGTSVVVSVSSGQISTSYGTLNSSKNQVSYSVSAAKTIYIRNEAYAIKVYNNCSSTPITFYGYSINAGSYRSLAIPRGTSVTIAHTSKPIEYTSMSGGSVTVTYSNNHKTMKFTVGSAGIIFEIEEYVLEYSVDIILSGTPANVSVKSGYSLSNVDPAGETYLVIYHSEGDDFVAPTYTCSGCEASGWYSSGTSTDDEGYTTTEYSLRIYNFTSYTPKVTFITED